LSLVFRVPYSQRYLFNVIPDTNHNANPTNPNRNSKGNPNPTNSTRGATTAEKLRGAKVWVPTQGRLRPAPSQRPG